MASSINPAVLWAQRKDRLLITIEIENITNENITIDSKKLILSAKGGIAKQKHHLEFEFYKDIIPEESKQRKSARGYYFQIKKKESGPYWPRMLKQTQKFTWLRIDFNKWKDEDASDEEIINDLSLTPVGSAENFDPAVNLYLQD
ncbi:uncharacterized protein TRIADDRAFT_54888 [Trichoplax adhaerens]|uniref:CS domain-containing protein n=1 Tax=Trichoplax adhaerens TaxID=10228 RepID=B3RT99_TRIAD|nr:hypothetical protein TRIADDRAFT_54888 [Trichoplax adhaerens]EDV27191.1 hypothetical protein TRIADDRAFT_54888 [Trichoplax adhaerens]|eukprot:XP_002111187.1 hypothetical protein TRIADDRAFT_54888 [Trichoplax adhaerens]